MAKTEMKKTIEEIKKWFRINISILTVGEDEQGNDVLMMEDDRLIDAICELNSKAMQEFAEAYHKEKLREELIAYEAYCCNCIPGLPKQPDEGKAILKLIDKYLKTLNNK